MLHVYASVVVYITAGVHTLFYFKVRSDGERVSCAVLSPVLGGLVAVVASSPSKTVKYSRSLHQGS